MIRKSPLATAVSTALATGGVSMPTLVLAQDDAADDGESIEQIVVTGSRIRKDVFTTSAPMDIVDVETASVQGIANLGNLLQSNTLAAGSAQVTAAIATEFVVDGGLGAQTISLRGLGANRTLTLINGRRAGPAGIKGSVSSFDLNVIPLSAIERVEILKDGASSIYGSDAIAGVVNIITKKEDGGTVEGFYSAPTESGGEETRVSASWGQAYDRGNFRLTLDYNERSDLKRGERDYFTCGNQYIFDQQTGERADVTDPRTGELWCEDLTWGHVWIYDYAADSNIPNPNNDSLLAQPDYGDNLGQYIAGYAPPANPSQLTQPGNFFPVGYDRLTDGITNDNHPFQDKQSLSPELEVVTFLGEGEFDLTESMTAYAEVLLSRRETYEDDYRQYWSYVYSGNFDFGSLGTGVPGGGNALAAEAGWLGEQWFSPTAISDHADAWNDVMYQRAVVGLRGELFQDWEWDLSYMYSNSDADYTEEVIFDDSIRDQNWLTGSCEGTTTSVRGVPCVDIPWFDPELLRGNISPELQDFLYGQETGNTEYTQWALDGYISGDIWELPAGPVGAAFGFHYRDDEINDTPGPVTLAGNSWFGDFAGITAGDDQTRALFAEFDIPILADMTGFQNLTVNASARWTDVESYGDDTTWKLGFNWQIIDSFRIRANKATSFRTPALFELYLADQTSSISQRSDPCIDYEAAFSRGDISENVRANCAADPAGLAPDYQGGTVTPTVFTGGGLGVLEAETADSLSVGFIWQPAGIDFSLAIDYFEFEVFDQVDQLGGARIIENCYESDFGFAFGNTEPLCQLFDRSGLQQGIDNVMDSYINVAEQRNRGYDIIARYGTYLGPGDMRIDFRATRQLEDFQALFDETPEDFNGRIGEPEWVGNLNVSYIWDNWAVNYDLDWIGESNSEEELGGSTVIYRDVTYAAVRYTDDVFYHALSASYDFDMGVRVLVGVANLTDEAPPQLTRIGESNEYAPVGNALLASNYDMFGRRFFMNATWDFQ